jgi:hypothetical protein
LISWQILDALLDAGPHVVSAELRYDVVMEAVKHNHLSVIRVVYEAGWRLHSADIGRWLLVEATEASIETLEYLLFTVGCDPVGRITYDAEAYSTILHALCNCGTLEQFALCIWAGAEIGAIEYSGRTSMSYALDEAMQGSFLMYKYLEYCGAVAHTTAERKMSLLKQYTAQKDQVRTYQRVVCGIKRRVRARIKARCRTPQDFYRLLWAVRSEPTPLVSQAAVDQRIDRFYSQHDAPAEVRPPKTRQREMSGVVNKGEHG